MSTWHPHTLACPHCGTSQTIMLLKGMHITRIPRVQRQILDGTFQLFPCTDCDSSFVVERQSVYTDFERGHYIAIEPVGSPKKEAITRHQKIFDEVFLFAPDVAQKLGRKLTRRLVFGLPALREKVLTWENGLADYALEAVKLSLLGKNRLNRESTVLRLVQVYPTGGHLLFALYDKPKVKYTQEEQIFPTPKPRDWYTALRQDYETILGDIPRLRNLVPELFGGWCVDISLLD